MSDPEEEEDDYLSPKFLQPEPATSAKGNKRDYASLRREAQRKSDDAQRRNNERTMSRKQVERSAREEGLSKNLISDARTQSSGNKALEMMTKMGYKPGQSLGQPTTQSSDEKQKRATPLEIRMREGRGGLGTEPVRPTPPAKRAKVHVEDDGDGGGGGGGVEEDAFKVHARSEAEARKHVGQLRSAQRTLRELDARGEVEASVLWVDPEVEEAEERRKVHAIRMGERELHVEDVLGVERTQVEEVEDGEKEAWCALRVEQRLDRVLQYLREHHKCVFSCASCVLWMPDADVLGRYCLFCGAQYASQQELDELCPGTQEDDH